MRAFLVVLIGLVVAGAYFLGHWPERQLRTAVESELKTANAQLADAQAQVRLCGLQNRLMTLIEKTAEKNYGDAQKLSTEFFDEVRKENARTEKANVQAALGTLLELRDPVTAALTKGDPAALELLQQAMAKLHAVAGPWAISGADAAPPSKSN